MLLFCVFFSLRRNPATIALVGSLFLLYIVLLIIALRLDAHDQQKGAIVNVIDNSPDYNQKYLITMETGFRKAAGTTAKVGHNTTSWSRIAAEVSVVLLKPEVAKHKAGLFQNSDVAQYCDTTNRMRTQLQLSRLASVESQKKCSSCVPFSEKNPNLLTPFCEM